MTVAVHSYVHLPTTLYWCDSFLYFLQEVGLLHVGIKSANSTFSLVRWWDITCSLSEPDCTCCKGVLSKLLTFHVLIIHRYRYKCTISVTQLVMQYFRSLETILDLYNLIIGLLCFNAYITSIHSNTCGRFGMIEPLIKRHCQIWNHLHATSRHLARLNVEFAHLIATCNKSM